MIKDIVVSAVLLAGSIGLYFSLFLMEDPQAVTFPRIVIIIMAVLAFLLLLQTLLLGSKTQSGTGGATFPFGRFLVCFILIVIYFVVMESLGFYVSAFLFFMAATFVLGWQDMSPRVAAVRVLMAFIFTGVLFFLFNKLLAVQTPKGILF